MNNFDLKKFLIENKLTTNSRMLNEEERSTNVFANTGDGFEEVESEIRTYVEYASQNYFEELNDPNAVVVSVGHFWSTNDGIAVPGISIKSSTIDKHIEPDFNDSEVDFYYSFFVNLLQPPQFQELSFEEKKEYYKKEFGDTGIDLEDMEGWSEDTFDGAYSHDEWSQARDYAQVAMKDSVLDQFEALNLGISRDTIEEAFDDTENSL